MSRIGQLGLSREERVKRGLMIWCALILFALGIWLLVEPAKARGSRYPNDQDPSLATPALLDNVIANPAPAARELAHG
jgi:hypothetical protein